MSLLVEKGWQYIRETFIRAKKTDRPAVNPPRERFLLRTYVSFFESKRKRGRKRAEAIPTNKNRSDRLRRASEESDTRASPSSASRAFSVPRVSRVSLPLFPRRDDFQSYAPERRGSLPVFGGLIFKAAANPRARLASSKPFSVRLAF